MVTLVLVVAETAIQDVMVLETDFKKGISHHMYSRGQQNPSKTNIFLLPNSLLLFPPSFTLNMVCLYISESQLGGPRVCWDLFATPSTSSTNWRARLRQVYKHVSVDNVGKGEGVAWTPPWQRQQQTSGAFLLPRLRFPFEIFISDIIVPVL